MSEEKRLHGFAQRADLIGLEQNRVCTAHRNPLFQPLGVGHEKVVADELTGCAQRLGQRLPRRPVLLSQRIFDGADGILRDELLPVFGQLMRGECAPAFGQSIAVSMPPFAGGGIERESKIRAWRISRAADGFEDEVKCLMFVRNLRRKAAFVADRS